MTDYDKFTSKSHCFLDVWDLPLRENINSGGLPRAIAEIRKPETTQAKLRSLEPQGEHSIRVFIEECCDSKEGTQETKGRYNPPSNLLSQNGFKSLISQLRCDASQWYQLDGYDFALDAKGFVSDSLARRKLPLRLSMAVQAGIDKLKSSMEQYRDTWARTSRSYITIRQGDDQGAGMFSVTLREYRRCICLKLTLNSVYQMYYWSRKLQGDRPIKKKIGRPIPIRKHREVHERISAAH